MDLFEAVARRHSYRGPYLDRPVPRDDLVKIVEAALKAPSGCNAQTTNFVVVDEPEKVAAIRKMHPVNEAMQQAHAYILCFVDKAPDAVYERFDFQVEDCAAAVENMLLAVTALGYATVWIDGWLRMDSRAEAIALMVGAPDSKQLRILLPLGVPAESWNPKEKKSLESRVGFNSYPSL